MMTPTHLLIAAAVLARPVEAGREPQRSRSWLLYLAVVAGALVPDFSIYVLFVWAKFMAGISSHELWTSTYWQEPWQTYSAIGNSLPLYLALLILGIFAKWRWLVLFALAALLHIGFDLPFHHSDAHKHFWPFTDYRFHSPLSYWNGNHHGDLVGLFERGIALFCIVLLWMWFQMLWLRWVLVAAAASNILVPLYFWWSLS